MQCGTRAAPKWIPRRPRCRCCWPEHKYHNSSQPHTHRGGGCDGAVGDDGDDAGHGSRTLCFGACACAGVPVCVCNRTTETARYHLIALRARPPWSRPGPQAGCRQFDRCRCCCCCCGCFYGIILNSTCAHEPLTITLHTHSHSRALPHGKSRCVCVCVCVVFRGKSRLRACVCVCVYPFKWHRVSDSSRPHSKRTSGDHHYPVF